MRRAPLDEVASLVHRVAVLLSAGVPPASVWAHLEEPSAALVTAGLARGRPVPDALQQLAADTGGDERVAWEAVAAAWAVSAEAGASLAPTLRRLAGTLRDVAQLRREAQVALAGPVATARLVMVLPMVSLVFGAALGFDTLGVLVGTPVGWACVGVGAALMLTARAWNRALVRRATPPRDVPGLDCDLMAIAISGGGSLDGARRLVAKHSRPPGPDADSAIEEVVSLSRRAGVPAVELLRAAAVEERRRSGADQQRAVARLGVTLMIPLGVCVLPAFLVLGVLPLMVSVISSTVSTF
ncbi:type II secretion system F family protein [Diaminobutyricimonas aerilata]|uniref:type II secretion system F family protein n=1 Tax=Diaminobutyricimonas aerilata TaxID=1162967 RepID=UPI000C244582|nr:type II secretion system F family protein [Diaminobutyricimonas aerilata]